MLKMKKKKQIGGTCGYYALINAINHVTGREKILTHHDVEVLLRTTIRKGYSNIGEIFSYADFQLIIDEFKEMNEEYRFNHEIVDFNVDLVNRIDKNQAILVNYSSLGQEKGEEFTNSHWVACVGEKKNKIKIINSSNPRKRYRIQDIYKKSKELKNKKFDWIEFLNSKTFETFYSDCGMLNRGFKRYLHQTGVEFKKKMINGLDKVVPVIVEHDYSNCILLTF